jgi:putative heme iron utilization protein
VGRSTNDVRAVLELVARATHASLATLARDPPGYPFVTLVAVAFDGRGRPLMLLSALAEHTMNLQRAAQASLAVAEPSASRVDPLSAARVTLVGRARPVGAAEDAAARAEFLAAHPEAASYAGLGDFGPWRLEVDRVRWVGGFGRMGWWTGEMYANAWSEGPT